MLERTSRNHPIEQIAPVMTRDELVQIQQEVMDVYVERNVQQYIVNIVANTRNRKEIFLGVSPRGSIALMKIAKAYAYIHGRDFVLPDDIKYLAPFVLSHRIILHSEARYDGKTNEEIVAAIVKDTFVPIRKDFG